MCVCVCVCSLKNMDCFLFKIIKRFFLCLSQDGEESTRSAFNHFAGLDTNVRNITRRFERLHLKILKKKQSMVFNRTFR